MKITHHSRLVVLTASISAALLLSACQPTNDKVETAAATEETAVVNDTDNVNDTAAATDAHTGHDMSAGTMAGAEHMTPMHQAYNRSLA